MSSHFEKLYTRKMLPTAPDFLSSAIQYEVIMGSVAYGVSNDSSDMDIYGFAIPPKDFVFPQLRGEIPGFDDFDLKFDQYQQHHIFDESALGGKGRTYDFTVYSIVKYFRLLMDNNPNIIDSLFVPDNCVLHSTDIGDMVRQNRQLFLHKGYWAKFKGDAYGQMHKIRTKKPEGKRKALVDGTAHWNLRHIDDSSAYRRWYSYDVVWLAGIFRNIRFSRVYRAGTCLCLPP